MQACAEAASQVWATGRGERVQRPIYPSGGSKEYNLKSPSDVDTDVEIPFSVPKMLSILLYQQIVSSHRMSALAREGDFDTSRRMKLV